MELYKKEAAIIRQYSTRRRARRSRWVKYIKTLFGCIDCGYNEHHAALHFDHVDRKLKVAPVSKMYSSSLKKLFAEIRKCEVRCAVCHAVKTYEQKQNVGVHKKAGRPQNIIHKALVDELLHLRKKGNTLRSISRELDIPYNAVRNAVIKYNDRRALND